MANTRPDALDKLKRKGLDLVAANQVGVAGTGFESDDNALSLYSAQGRQDIASPQLLERYT